MKLPAQEVGTAPQVTSYAGKTFVLKSEWSLFQAGKVHRKKNLINLDKLLTNTSKVKKTFANSVGEITLKCNLENYGFV